jgi:hypothetical protein
MEQMRLQANTTVLMARIADPIDAASAVRFLHLAVARALLPLTEQNRNRATATSVASDSWVIGTQPARPAVPASMR